MEQARTLEAMCALIIPEDADPGAERAGVVRYIDLQLNGHFRKYLTAYRDGIATADRKAGGSFAAAPAAVQLQTLRQMEKGEDTRVFFELLVAHTMQGFYGTPRHGGNRDFTSWRMLKIPISPVRGRW